MRAGKPDVRVVCGICRRELSERGEEKVPPGWRIEGRGGFRLKLWLLVGRSRGARLRGRGTSRQSEKRSGKPSEEDLRIVLTYYVVIEVATLVLRDRRIKMVG